LRSHHFLFETANREGSDNETGRWLNQSGTYADVALGRPNLRKSEKEIGEYP
jgi:hypothetical protein